MTSKVKTTKETDKFVIINMKNFCVANDTIKKVKRQLTDWERMFLYHISEKELISRIHKELSNNKKTNNPTRNGQKICTDISLQKIYNGTDTTI